MPPNNIGCFLRGTHKEMLSSIEQSRHTGLLHKLSKLQFSTSLIKLISSFLSERKFRDSVEGEMSTPREMQAGVPQGSVISPTLYNLYINDNPPPPHTIGVNLALFANDTCIYATERKEGYDLVKLQRAYGLV
jgi:hypothetical protein